MAKKNTNSIFSDAKDTIKVGMTGMAGYGILGSMENIPGMPVGAKNITSIAGAGFQLANIGQLAKTGMNITNSFGNNKKYKKGRR